MYHKYWLIWLSLITLAANVEHEYCSLRYHQLCKGKGTHIGCMFPKPGCGPTCDNCTSVEFTDNVKNFILNFINSKRNRIAAGRERVKDEELLPRPEIMMFVGWDNELAYLAQRLADQCLFSHDECRATVRYPYAGQTVGEVRWRSDDNSKVGVTASIGRIFNAWWGEKRRVTVKQIVSPFKLPAKGVVWGHFSQLAKAQLRGIGCGAVIHGVVNPRLLLACDFSHTNMLGQPTYVPIKLHPQLKIPKQQQKLQINQENEDYNENHENYEGLNEATLKTRSTETAQQTRMKTRSRGHTTLDKVSGKPRISTKGSIELLNRKKLISEANRRIYPNNITEDRYEKYQDMYEYMQEHHTKVNTDNIASVRFRTTSIKTMFADDMKQTARQRWKQTRNRPRRYRPGATALFNSVQVQVVSIKPSVAPITLDRDDMEQLYRDTGFKAYSNKRKYIRK